MELESSLEIWKNPLVISSVVTTGIFFLWTVGYFISEYFKYKKANEEKKNNFVGSLYHSGDNFIEEKRYLGQRTENNFPRYGDKIIL